MYLTQGLCYLKPTDPVERWQRHTGPEQKCNLDLKCGNSEQWINKIKDLERL